jgi:hypothetical protein
MESLAVLLQKPKITKYMLFNDVYFRTLKSERVSLSFFFQNAKNVPDIGTLK